MPKHNQKHIPLAARMRPRTAAEFFGQSHLLKVGQPLRQAIDQGLPHSMILWGPPGTGKTTLARLIATRAQAHIETISAVFSGVKEIREAVTLAQQLRVEKQQATLLFVDEIHRFNKSQQDAFLPFVEEGVITLIGATTENPSFELNSALLSRARVYVFKSLTVEELMRVMEAALSDKERGLGERTLHFPENLRTLLAQAADGDARRLLNLLEIAADLAESNEITENTLQEVFTGHVRRFDKKGEMFYDQISALHKSVRGTDPDAALYWFARMLDGGCNPEYLGRRIVRMACEDIGNADPRALQLALNACETYDRLGSPEGELAFAQAVVYLACAPKSNAVYVAFKEAMKDAEKNGSLEVPLHLRNAPTALMRSLDYGKNYRYAHDEPDAYCVGEKYFPDEMTPRRYYSPPDRGLEIKIAEKLKKLKESLEN